MCSKAKALAFEQMSFPHEIDQKKFGRVKSLYGSQCNTVTAFAIQIERDLRTILVIQNASYSIILHFYLSIICTVSLHI